MTGKPSQAARMARIVFSVVCEHPRSTTAEVVLLTYECLKTWHSDYSLPTCAPTAGLRQLERRGRVLRIRGGEPRWVANLRIKE